VPSPLGFVLLTHDRPTQAVRLVDRLNTVFDSPPIAWHHDFDQTPLAPRDEWTNVVFVRPHVPTRWGTFTLVDAVMRAIRLLYDGSAQPSWCAVLSGADYPIKAASKILEDLDAHDVDAHIEAVEIKPAGWDTSWEEMCFERYHTVALGVGSRRKRLDGRLARRLLSPFTSTYRCYAGSNWFTLSARAARRIVAFDRRDRRLARHLQHALLPEECYFQTVLANTRGMRIRPEYWHYVDWSGESDRHPKTLCLEDLDELRRSSAHFARKLDLERCPELYDELDSLTGAR
jgi:Core-2/I-Branching enzyme